MAELKQMIALNYDLDDELLKKYYPNPKSYKNAWRDVKSFLCKNGFESRQYSGVISSTPMSSIRAKRIFNKLLNEFNWLEPCIQKFDITKFDKELSLIDEWRETNFLKNVVNIDISNPDKTIDEGRDLSTDSTSKKVDTTYIKIKKDLNKGNTK